MSPNEEYVIGTLAAKFGGTFKDCEHDAPDGFISVRGTKIAVEVSRLVERVTTENGALVSRLGHDVPAEQMASEIEEWIGRSIPDGVFVLLILSPPIKNIRRTKRLVAQAILNLIAGNQNSEDLTVSGNAISVSVIRNWSGNGRKMGSAIHNRYSSANVSGNAAELLRDRIESKKKIDGRSPCATEYWLALYNDYWIADAGTYRVAYRGMQIDHDFNHIFIVDGYGRAHELCR